ncbi:MAG: PP2C family protein-serine/threonine phosphatase [Bdellovibrionales bacterium]
MSKSENHLISKIKFLEKQIKEKEELLTKYQETINFSNDRIEKIAKNVKEGLSLMAGIHKNLIPVDLPEIPYFEFSYKFLPTSSGVSGDFFDVVKIKDSLKFGIVLSSCNTYAMTALFVSSFLKSSQNLKNYKDSKDFLSYVADSLSESFPELDKIDLFYGIVDRKNFTLDYCLVGDIFAALKTEEGDYEVLKAGSKSLKDKSIKNKTLSLNPKDRFVFCSSGVSAVQNSQGESFGNSRILQYAKEAKDKGVLGIRQNILFECDQFGQGVDTSKDKTILVMEVKERVLKLTTS